MTTTFLHTADWQFGKPFAGVEDLAKRALVQQERIEAVKRLGEVARQHQAAFIVVAGDLFDSPRATRDTVSAACAAIGALERPVYAIPGNHDPGGPGGLWEQPFFQREQAQLAPNLTILLAPAPLVLDTAVLFPCPLLRQRETTDPTSWLRAGVTVTTEFGDQPRIVLAHGSTQEFAATDDDEEETVSGANAANLLHLAQLPEADFDYLALGDWHGTKQIDPKSWYAGTPEPDRFPRGAANQPGQVLVVTAERGGRPQVQSVPTARLRWHRLEHECHAEEGLAPLEAKVTQRIGARAREDLLRLELTGALDLETATRLEALLESWKARLLRLKLINRTRLAPSAAELDALAQRTADPLISRVARQLITEADGEGETAGRARLALRELHTAIIEA